MPNTKETKGVIRGISAARSAAATLAELDPDDMIIADARVAEFERTAKTQIVMAC